MRKKSYSIACKQPLIQEAFEGGNARQVAIRQGMDGKLLSLG